MSEAHTVPLGTTDWRVWRGALLRAAGFPAEGVLRFAAPSLAAAADARLDDGEDEPFAAAFAEAVAAASRTVTELAGDPLLREAITWQNPGARVTMLDAILARGADAPRNARRRGKEASLARYYARYTTKNDTIGFFGPVCWARLVDDGPPVEVKAGGSLLRRRRVFLERWAVAAYAEALLADDAVRAWAPPRLAATVHLDGDEVAHPTGERSRLSPTEHRIVARCDGRLPAAELAAALVADPDAGVRRTDDVMLHLRRLVDRGLLRWDFDLPMSMEAVDTLADRVAAIGDDALRTRAADGLQRLVDGAAAVGAAAGDETALASALAALDATFEELTERSASRAEGQMYAGRTVCFEETVRDLDVQVGPAVLDGLAAPLDLLLRSARWLSVELAETFERVLGELFDDLRGQEPAVGLGTLWFLAQGLLFGATGPVDDVTSEFTRRWAPLLRLDGGAGGAREVSLTAAELEDAVAAAFPARTLRWGAARYHSPDVHVVLDPDDTGEPDAAPGFVLGELHAAWNTATPALFVFGHDDPDALRAVVAAELPPGRVVPVLPAGWPRLTPRTANALLADDVVRLGIDPDTPGPDVGVPLPMSALKVERGDGPDGGLVATTSDGRRWPIAEVFGELLASTTVDAFKLLGQFEHTPRVCIDDLVVARESWTQPAERLTFTDAGDPAQRYLAVRRWARQLGLPDRVFVKTAAEVKPMYLDLTSPVFVDVLCVAVRAAERAGGPGAGVTFTEMLPTPEQAFVPDADGARYASELRLQVVDSQTVDWEGVS